MTESGRVRPNLKYRPSVSVEELARREFTLAVPECFASFIRETVPKRVSENLRIARGGSYLACTFKVCAIFRIRARATVPNRARAYLENQFRRSFSFLCARTRRRVYEFPICAIKSRLLRANHGEECRRGRERSRRANVASAAGKNIFTRYCCRAEQTRSA